jgi:hypothetical protein
MWPSPGSFARPEPNFSHTLPFPPPTAAVTLSKPRQFPNSGPGGDGLDTGNIAEDFEIHSAMLSDVRG